MNKKNAHLYLPLVTALSEGKTIQFDGRDCQDAIYFDSPPERYRIKPELMEFYAVANDNKTDTLSGIFKTENAAAEYLGRQGWTYYTKIVHMREVAE